MMFALTLFGLTAAAGVNPPDAEIENAIVVDIPPDGFQRVVEIIPALLPMDMIDDISEEIERGGSCLNDVWFDISDLNIGVEVADADIIPKEGFLDFSIALDVNINDSINPFLLDYMLSLCIEYNCEAYVDPFKWTLQPNHAGSGRLKWRWSE